MEENKERVYTIKRFDKKGRLKNFKKTESEMNEEDILYFYRRIADLYNNMPMSAQMAFMEKAIPPYMELMKKFSGNIKN